MTSHEPRKKTSRWFAFTAVAVLILGGYVVWQRYRAANLAAEAKAKPTVVRPVPVRIGTADTAAFPVYVNSLGTVQAYNTVLVRTRVDGQIDKVAFKEGQLVQKGDLLVEIDPRPYQALLEQAQAKKTQDEANLKNANLDLNRYTQLGEFATRQQTDTQRATVAQLTAQIAADQAAIDSAQTQLNYATIQSPITGIAGFRQVDIGNIVNAATQTGIVTITQVEPISVVYTAPQEQLQDINQAVKAGPVQVLAYTTDGKKKLSEGVLETINNQVDTTSGTIRLKATFKNADHALWPGLAISTRMLVDTLKSAVTVPDDAVQHGPLGLFVYLVDDSNKATVQKIAVGPSEDGRTVVQSGLAAGQKVITAGQYRVDIGTLVSNQAAPADQASNQGKVQ